MATTLKAEMWDRMQFLFRNYYDRMVHAKLTYEGSFDMDVLKNVVLFMVEKAPVLHSSFNTTVIEPYWKEENYTIDDIVSYEKVEDDKHSVLALRNNHMCMDGGDLKYFLATLCENYPNLKAGNYSALHMKSGSRSYDQVYSKLEGEDLKHAKNLYKNISKTEDKVAFPWSESVPEDTNKIIKRVINEEDFDKP